MDMNTSSTDWASIIAAANASALQWYQVTHNQPIVPVNQGGALAVTSQGLSATASPGLLLLGAVAIVALVYVLKN